MKLYYRAVTQDGKTIRGLIDARDPREAATYLRQHQLVPIKIEEATQAGMQKYFHFLRKSSKSELVFFTRQLASMLASGLTLMQALNIMKNQIQTPAMVEVLETVVADIENGKTFSDAIKKYPKLFSPIYVALIRTAETSGLLDKILLRLADDLEKGQNLSRTIKGALTYPIIVILMMIGLIIVMMVFVVPQLTLLYGNVNTTLPITTQIIIGLSNFTVKYWLFVVVFLVGAVYYGQHWYHTESGRRTVDTYLLRIPVFGKLLMNTMMSDFARTLGLLISSGSLVVDSLQKSSAVVNNVLYQKEINLVAKRVEKGISIGNALQASPLFPPMVVEMVKIGEETGKVDESLSKAADYYEREVEATVKTLTALMEPIIMIMLAFGVGFLVMAVITPIYSLMSSIQ